MGPFMCMVEAKKIELNPWELNMNRDKTA